MQHVQRRLGSFRDSPDGSREKIRPPSLARQIVVFSGMAVMAGAALINNLWLAAPASLRIAVGYARADVIVAKYPDAPAASLSAR